MTDGAVQQICFELARRLDLGAIRPRVIGRFSNVAVALDPLPIVARIATGTALIRDTRAFAEREVNVGRFLAGRGAPVIPPHADLPGPHEVDGWVVTRWELVTVLDGSPDPAEAGSRLAQCHRILREYPPTLSYFGAFEELTQILQHPHVQSVLPQEDRDWIGETSENLRAQLETYRANAQIVHGDSHRKNVIQSPAGALWTDWEDTIFAPVEWDLACMVTTARVTGQDREWAETALSAYGPCDSAALELCIQARAVFGAAWLALLSADLSSNAPARLERLHAWLKWLRTE